MTASAVLFHRRGAIAAVLGLAALAIAYPPRPDPRSSLLLAAGLALRLWARRHIGGHSRGATVSAPYRAAGGPYRFLSHPLYAANLLVVAGLLGALCGAHPLLALALWLPFLVLYAALAAIESRHLRLVSPPVRRDPLPPADRRTRSEWASVVPPLAAWILLWWLGTRGG